MALTPSPGLVAVAVAGSLSFLSPCMIPVVPAFLARISGLSGTDRPPRRQLFLHAVLFVAGFAIVFATLGVALESALSAVSTEIRDWLARAAGLLVIGFGLHLTGIVEFNLLDHGATLPAIDRDPGMLTTLALGGAFAVTWTPCVGPLLGSTYALAATQPIAAFPVFLSYSLGLGVPFLLTALVPERATRTLSGSGRTASLLHRASGVVLLGLGVLVFTQRLDLLGAVVYVQEFI
jgi:Cytochrome c biogenesis protein